MRSWLAGLRTLILPWGAPSGAPRIVLGADLPADLIAYYAGFGETALTGMVLYRGTNVAYDYLILVYDAGGGVFLCTGAKSAAGNINEISRSFGIGGSSFMQIGTRTNFAALEIINGANLHVQNTSQLIVADSASQTFRDATNLVFIGTAVAQWLAGTKVWMETGSVLQIDAGAAFTIDGLSAARGLVGEVSALTNSAAVGAETAVLTTPSINFADQRAFMFEYGAQHQASIANIVTYRVRRTNAAGALVLGGFQHDGIATSNRWAGGRQIALNTSGGVVSYAACLTLQASGGTATQIASANLARWFTVSDIGAAADYGGAGSYPPV